MRRRPPLRSARIASLGCLALAVLGWGSLAAPAADDRPNILFIFSDDHSHRTVGCYPEADPWVRTPHLDALAARGVRFAHATIGTWCMPSRATLLTGLLPWGVQTMRMEGPYPGSEYDPERCRFWPAVFRQHGYQTAQIGKWHTGTDTGYGRDWDYQIVWNRPRHPENSGSYYDKQLIEKNGAPAERVTGYSTDHYTDWALRYLRGEEGRVPGKPWYLWLCYGAVHGPYTPAERHRGAFAEVPVETPADVFPPRPGKPAYVRDLDTWVPGPGGEPVLKKNPQKSLADAVRQYHEGVLALDEGIGRLLAALRETGQDRNTLVVFTSDQGFGWGQHGFQSKLAPYDATIRSPLIVSFPGRIPEGRVCAQPVGGADLVPTFFAYAGIDLPWEMHGHDLSPWLADPETGDGRRRGVLTALTGASYGADCDTVPTPDDKAKLYRGSGVPWWVSWREGNYKYIRTLVAGEVEELYDLEADPEELDNLARRAGSRETVLRYRDAAIGELRRTGAKMADALPPVAELPE